MFYFSKKSINCGVILHHLSVFGKPLFSVSVLKIFFSGLELGLKFRIRNFFIITASAHSSVKGIG
ncbi:MAG: hypothetical protein D8M57_17600 [Candidatus Scalindua sp. AMX11]|nr:MAG: hypothetical protein DWQ00_10440 [Candidatus Scalindua sp.]TDE63567.1 MAG: hypothetical protein D8M57_17600 [Candidatus Scalindua sp. AMX11]